MIGQRAFDSSAVVLTGALLLLLLPLSGECQSESVEEEEVIEEIVVRAEEALYKVFNSLNSDDDFDIHCYMEAPTGSKLKVRVCKTQKLGKILAEQTQAMMRGEPYVFPTDAVNPWLAKQPFSCKSLRI